MKKTKGLLIAGLIAIVMALTGCAGSFTLKDAVVVAKTSPPISRSPGVVQVEKDGSMYSFRVGTTAYYLVEVGSRIDVRYSSVSERATFMPTVK